ncbi:anhydro-N-acetylmuramic acid kinase AnmK [Facklamia miroungae]|uniref:Anhydro-N-acetylmuramic acid kinase n=1 Tax=Facklamia miroungae TaxID=120956 RepID=A0A1G7RW73_9LACT|nr:anhydro-N-acetylmuramic acid kinase AnmK [Facklamia miroungae]NKZ29251.1 anhydro-N-acetylmuramic acid kinase [Facklamia miroungae]SDG15035.1 anhydro-N-acetylmuramic acid kinase [Facklamia miroungae]
MKAIGIMSGTSLDGVDVVLCEINGVDEETQVKELAFKTFKFERKLKSKLEEILEEKKADLASICSINFELGEFFAECCLKLCQAYGINSTELAFIASHGQTIYHISENSDSSIKSTLQLGESALIAERCGCQVISNFRSRDMAVGGQGAPLVPYSEYILYKNKQKSYGFQNIGGIGNITIIPKNAQKEQVFAFDTGPGNMMINQVTKILYDTEYDNAGRFAAKGKLIKPLQEELMGHPYLKTEPPKSTGREMFGDDYTNRLLEKYFSHKKEDLVATFTWFTAYCIYYSYEQFIKEKTIIDELVVGGGGAHNLTLLTWIKKLLPTINVLTQEEIGMSSDSKEAVAFVILGNQTYHRRPSNLPSVTGARKNVILGQITYP